MLPIKINVAGVRISNLRTAFKVDIQLSSEENVDHSTDKDDCKGDAKGNLKLSYKIELLFILHF